VRLVDVLTAGIDPFDVAYAFVAILPSGKRRMLEATKRSYDRPSGMSS
jgi:hypothetical protein